MKMPAQRTTGLLRVALGLLLAMAALIGIGEALGWPFLAGPMQRWLGSTLDRRVRFAADAEAPSTVRIHLIGGIRVEAAYIEIGAPAWSSAPHMLLARDARLLLGYGDLWRAHGGAALQIRELTAAQLDLQLERLADGRASWTFGPLPHDDASGPARLPGFERLQVAAGTAIYRDMPMALDIDAGFSSTEGTGESAPAVPAAAASAAAPGLQLHATGHFRTFPLKLALTSPGALALLASGGASAAVPVNLDATIGRASLSFKGSTSDALQLGGLQGWFNLTGPSLAAVGDPVGITLPTTAAFSTRGVLAKNGRIWNVVIDQATIGASRVSGAFVYDVSRPHPLLSGRLKGSTVLLADLGPALGAPVPGQPAAVPQALPDRSARARGKVLPDRPFDLAALRAMDANVLVEIADLDLGSHLLQPLKPVRTQVVLQAGVLTLRAIDARTAQGRLGGEVRLDGRQAIALWTSDLNWHDVRLEHWVHQSRTAGAPPYVSGRLNGRARLSGQGRSTAAILGSMRGGVQMHLLDGSVSHLAIEAAGLDLAQGLGVLIKGDDALPVQCAVADLVAEKGVLRPRVLVLDTTDSTVLIDGSLSLATEALDLRVVVSPKDFSPLAFRTPIHVRGSFAQPSVSVESSKLAARVGAAALLALLNPLAALVPLMDPGSVEDAQHGLAACETLRQRARSRLPARTATTADATPRGR